MNYHLTAPNLVGMDMQKTVMLFCQDVKTPVQQISPLQNFVKQEENC